MKKSEQLQEDGDRLAEWFARLKKTGRMTKAKFAQKYKIPGGASMLSQHISGYRPISLDAAVAYVQGFKGQGFDCNISDISPRIAEELRRAGRAGAPVAGHTVNEPTQIHSQLNARATASWPFEQITPEDVARLSPKQLGLIESHISEFLSMVQDSKQKRPAKKTSAS